MTDANHQSPPGQPAKGSPHRRLTAMYILGLSLIALLTITSQLLVQHQLGQQQSDAELVALAQRQRMLSQRITKISLEIQYSADDREERIRLCRQLELALERFIAGHVALRLRSDDSPVPGRNSRTVNAQFEAVQDYYEPIVRDGKRIMRTAGAVTLDERTLRIIHNCCAVVAEADDPFLTGMGRIVQLYVSEAMEKVSRLRSIELWLMVLTLVVLALEAALIFRPAAMQIKRQFARLREANREVRETNEAMGMFFAKASHELRTPLVSVNGFSEVLLEGLPGPLNDQQRTYLQRIHHNGSHLLAIVNDLLDLSKIKAGKLEIRRQEADLALLCKEALSVAGGHAQGKPVELRETLPGGRVVVEVDPLRLKQAVVNLLSNALKFTDEGYVELRLAVDGNAARITVSDTGSGIAPEQLEQIFRPFGQASGAYTAAKELGTGLGLTLVREIIEAHGGTVSVDSTPGEGSVFTLAIPLAQDGKQG